VKPDWPRLLAAGTVTARAPCRIDLGGTLDIPTIGMPLGHLSPCTFNIALDLPTRVEVTPYRPGWVSVASRGFETALFRLDEAPFDHPLGLIFAIAACFQADGVAIEIDSRSPPRSALGGSSVAAVALVGAFVRILAGGAATRTIDRCRCALMAHRIEAAVAGVPCGLQDQLAAAYGGINGWYWDHQAGGRHFHRRRLGLIGGRRRLNDCLLLAYAGRPHASCDVNGQWIRGFLQGHNRQQWRQIAALTHDFIDSWHRGDMVAAAAAMNAETDLRRQMTPQVLDPAGQELVDAAAEAGCGARFAGAGGGGCVWALGPETEIAGLRETWQNILAAVPHGVLLPVCVDTQGLKVSVVSPTRNEVFDHPG
jgi:D-glycero-alpha-D-manno-heptose-7-phosphate kinase